MYKKHYPPALNDDVWRLEKIGKDGAFHKKLNAARIFTVEDFLRTMVRDSAKLRTVSAFIVNFCARERYYSLSLSKPWIILYVSLFI